MIWLRVMTLPDGTTIEIPVPSPDDTDADGTCVYRVRGLGGVVEFSTLPEVAHHVLDPWTPTLEAELHALVKAAPAHEHPRGSAVLTPGRRSRG